MGHSLKNQSNHCVSLCYKPGRSKRADRLNQKEIIGTKNKKTNAVIYSMRSASKMRDFSNMLTTFIMKEKPQIKMIRDITPEILQKFIDERSSAWSNKTIDEYRSRFSKMQDIWNAGFNLNLDIVKDLKFPEHIEKVKIKDHPMLEKDFKILNETMLAGRSKARLVPGAIRMTAARLEEICSVNIERDIKIYGDRAEISLTNCKNGRNRVVPISKENIPELKRMIEHCHEQGWKTLGGDLKANSVTKAIKRVLEKCELKDKYPNENTHNIRKLAARSLLCQKLGINLEDLENGKITLDPKDRNVREAWCEIQNVYLGHGRNHRQELFNAYIGH